MKQKKDPNINYELLKLVEDEYWEKFPKATKIKAFPNGIHELVIEVWGCKGAGVYPYPTSAYKITPGSYRRK